jgi:hypothetical protein
MKKFNPIVFIICFTCISQGMPLARAEDGNWTWGPLTSWKMPDVAGGIQRTGKKVTDQTAAAWNSTTRATKKAWKKTTEVLDPFPDNSTTTNNPSPWAAGGSNSQKKSNSSGGMFSWFSGKQPEETKPSTPSEFLRGERP